MKTHGGSRKGAGRPKTEETTSTGFRINTESMNICKEYYGRTLNRMVNDYIKRLAKNILNKS